MQENQVTTQVNNAYNSAYGAHEQQEEVKIKPYQYLLIGVAGLVKLCFIGFLILVVIISIGTIGHSYITPDTDISYKTMNFKYPSEWKISSNSDHILEIKSDENFTITAYTGEVWKDNTVNIVNESGGVDDYFSTYAYIPLIYKDSTTFEDVTIDGCKAKYATWQADESHGGQYAQVVAIYDGFQIDIVQCKFSDVSYSDLAKKILDSVTINKHTHKETTYTTEAQATCSQEGKEVCDCEGSEHKLVKTTAKLNHTPGDWTVQKDYSVSSSGTVTPGTEIRKCTVCGEQVDSRTYTITLTKSQQNACKAAQSYLKSQSFSYSGLIKQLEFEKYSNEDATFAVDHCGADWNEQAAKTAQSYLKTMSFSRGELIDQLVFEGFSTEQAEYGVNSVGL